MRQRLLVRWAILVSLVLAIGAALFPDTADSVKIAPPKSKKQASNCQQCDPAAQCRVERPGYDEVVHCSCPAGYQDASPDKSSSPGRVCKQLVNECLNPYANDCDQQGATCTDLPDGYHCECKTGYKDISPDQAYRGGRRCEAPPPPPPAYPAPAPAYPAPSYPAPSYPAPSYPAPAPSYPAPAPAPAYPAPSPPAPVPPSPCQPSCAPEANCVPQTYETSAGNDTSGTVSGSSSGNYECVCPSGYSDASSDPNKPGRACQKQENKCLPPFKHDCSKHAECVPILANSTYTCKCNEGYADESPEGARPGTVCRAHPCQSNTTECDENAKCVENDETPPPNYCADMPKYASRYITTDVINITHPHTFNNTWNDGTLVTFNVSTLKTNQSVDVCDLWASIAESIRSSNGSVGGCPMHIDLEKNALLNPCPPPNYCADMPKCPVNMTCVNLQTHAECQCLPGLVDVRNMTPEAKNASALAPEQVCTDLCHRTDNGTIVCPVAGAVVPPIVPQELVAGGGGIAPLILALILAILFLILACCCLLWLCSKLRWFKRHPWKTLSEADSSMYDQNIVIPRAQLKSSGSIASGGSEFTIREEIEHHVTTDIIRTEETMSVGGEEHEEHEVVDRSAQRAVYHGYGYR